MPWWIMDLRHAPWQTGSSLYRSDGHMQEKTQLIQDGRHQLGRLEALLSLGITGSGICYISIKPGTKEWKITHIQRISQQYDIDSWLQKLAGRKHRETNYLHSI